MASKSIFWPSVALILLSINLTARAQQGSLKAPNVDVGKYEYDAHCAECHGLAGKGNGPYVQLLRPGIVLPDLTQLSKKNDGVFPVKRVVEIIDGREPVRAHGPTDMPIWGQRYRIQSQNVNPDYNPEAFARVKILFLTEYLYRLQSK